MTSHSGMIGSLGMVGQLVSQKTEVVVLHTSVGATDSWRLCRGSGIRGISSDGPRPFMNQS